MTSNYELESPILTEKQSQSLDLFALGLTDGEIAQTVGVKRETVNRWRHHDSALKKAIELRHKQLTFDAYFEQMQEDLELLAEAFKKYLPKKYYRPALSYLRLLRSLVK